MGTEWTGGGGDNGMTYLACYSSIEGESFEHALCTVEKLGNYIHDYSGGQKC